MNDNVNPLIARALAPFTPPDDERDQVYSWGFFEPDGKGGWRRPVRPSLVVPCPACYGGWRDTPTGTVMCGQCGGTGRVATNQGEP